MPPIDERLVHEVVQLHQEGMSWRAIARALHISRNTVRQLVTVHGKLREATHSALARPRTISQPRPSKLDAFRGQVDALLKQYPDITAQRVFESLKEQGFTGAYTGVKVLVRRLRPKPPPTPSLETPRREPGDLAECDWSPYVVSFTHAPPMTLQAFGYTLRYSTLLLRAAPCPARLSAPFGLRSPRSPCRLPRPCPLPKGTNPSGHYPLHRNSEWITATAATGSLSGRRRRAAHVRWKC